MSYTDLLYKQTETLVCVYVKICATDARKPQYVYIWVTWLIAYIVVYNYRKSAARLRQSLDGDRPINGFVPRRLARIPVQNGSWVD